MQILKQSTQIKVRIGPVVDVTDAFTPITTLNLSTADEAEALKADGAATVSIAAATFAAITGADGYYDLTLTTSHTDTVGTLDIAINDDSLCLPVRHSFQVVEEATFDFLYASGATPIADINAEADTAITDAALATAAALATVDTVVDGIQTDLDNATDGLGAIKTDTAAILLDTAEIGTAGAGLTDLGGMSTAMKAEVNAEADTAITDGSLATAAALATVDTVVDGIQTDLSNATDGLGALKALIDALPSAAAINAEVDTAFTTIMADSVPADGTIPTREQALYMINQFLLERATSGTTVTVKKVDGSTALLTLTLDDATNPTSITRAT